MFNFNEQMANENLVVRRALADAKALKALQNQLSNSDYKIIKCYEYSLMNLELPYDIEGLHAEREALREEIRKLQEKLY